MLEIYDCTLREGMQAEGLSFSVSDKLAVIKALDSLGTLAGAAEATADGCAILGGRTVGDGCATTDGRAAERVAG